MNSITNEHPLINNHNSTDLTMDTDMSAGKITHDPHPNNTIKKKIKKRRGKSKTKTVVKRGRWEVDEKKTFLRGLRIYGKGKWKAIATLIPHRTTIQVKTHAQMVLKKINAGEDVFALLNEDDEYKPDPGVSNVTTVGCSKHPSTKILKNDHEEEDNNEEEDLSSFNMECQEDIDLISSPMKSQSGALTNIRNKVAINLKSIDPYSPQSSRESGISRMNSTTSFDKLPPLPLSDSFAMKNGDSIVKHDRLVASPMASSSKTPTLTLSPMNLKREGGLFEPTSPAVMRTKSQTDVALAAEVLLGLGTPAIPHDSMHRHHDHVTMPKSLNSNPDVYKCSFPKTKVDKPSSSGVNVILSRSLSLTARSLGSCTNSVAV